MLWIYGLNSTVPTPDVSRFFFDASTCVKDHVDGEWTPQHSTGTVNFHKIFNVSLGVKDDHAADVWAFQHSIDNE